VAAAEDEDDGEGGGARPSMQEDLGWQAAAPPLLDVAVPEGAPLKQAGCVSALLEGMVVVQGLENSRALDEG
jgi:hypothetical protein